MLVDRKSQKSERKKQVQQQPRARLTVKKTGRRPTTKQTPQVKTAGPPAIAGLQQYIRYRLLKETRNGSVGRNASEIQNAWSRTWKQGRAAPGQLLHEKRLEWHPSACALDSRDGENPPRLERDGRDDRGYHGLSTRSAHPPVIGDGPIGAAGETSVGKRMMKEKRE